MLHVGNVRARRGMATQKGLRAGAPASKTTACGGDGVLPSRVREPALISSSWSLVTVSIRTGKRGMPTSPEREEGEATKFGGRGGSPAGEPQ